MSTYEQRDFFKKRTPVTPSPTLEQLMEQVFVMSTKRSPEWKFRLAPDLILEMEPKAGAIRVYGEPENLKAVRWSTGVRYKATASTSTPSPSPRWTAGSIA